MFGGYDILLYFCKRIKKAKTDVYTLFTYVMLYFFRCKEVHL